jgi:pimeloyl-ACP methyl ester carboxylesterase
MIERAATFGQSGNLVGVVSEPDAAPPPARPDVIVLNTGQNHKVGTYRMTVDLARALAGRGSRVLRFDLSGFGDSRMRVAREPGEDIPVADVRAAMDFLRDRYGAQKFVLMGLCSGSDNSHRTSVADPRVVGAVHLDGIGYRTPKYYAVYWGRRFLSKTYLVTQTKLKLTELGRAKEPPVADAYNRPFPPIEQMARDFTALVARGVRLLYIYNRGAHLYTNYPEQLQETFPSVDFKDCLDVEVNHMIEHTYPLVRSRAALIARIAAWTERHFAREKPAPREAGAVGRPVAGEL